MTRKLTCAVLVAAAMLPAAAWAQSTEGAQANAGQAAQTRSESTRAGTATTRAQSESDDWQEARNMGTSTSKDTDAPARDRQATTGDDFDALDTDHDGRLSRAEAGVSQQVGGRFRTLDADGDGYVSNSEYREGLRATRTPTTSP